MKHFSNIFLYEYWRWNLMVALTEPRSHVPMHVHGTAAGAGELGTCEVDLERYEHVFTAMKLDQILFICGCFRRKLQILLSSWVWFYTIAIFRCWSGLNSHCWVSSTKQIIHYLFPAPFSTTYQLPISEAAIQSSKQFLNHHRFVLCSSNSLRLFASLFQSIRLNRRSTTSFLLWLRSSIFF